MTRNNTCTKCLTQLRGYSTFWVCRNEMRCLSESTVFPLFSILSRSEDKTELQSSSPARGENAGRTLPEYSKELEMLCEELQTTFNALVRSRTPDHLCSQSPNPRGVSRKVWTLWEMLSSRHLLFPPQPSPLVSSSSCPLNLDAPQDAVLDLHSFSPV